MKNFQTKSLNRDLYTLKGQSNYQLSLRFQDHSKKLNGLLKLKKLWRKLILKKTRKNNNCQKLSTLNEQEVGLV